MPDPGAIYLCNCIAPWSANGKVRWDRMASIIRRDPRCIDPASDGARRKILFHPECDVPASINPGSDARVFGSFTFAGLRLENDAIHPVDRFVTDDRLILPSEEILDQIFVRQVGSEERILQLRSGQGLNLVWR